MSKNWAICIGINGYYNLKHLAYARQDAAAMRDFCLATRFEQVYLFAENADPIATDHGPPLRSEPTIGNLERFFNVRFAEPFLEAGDNLWFFFAGHGRRHEGRDYLMPLDGDPSNIERTGLALRDISDRLRRCGADNIILMLDACRDEDSRSGGSGIGVEKQGVVTLFSCSPSQSSYEIEELGQGAFTYALLEGLRIQGEGNCATVERLYQHLRYQVPNLNQRYRKPVQTPYAIVEPATKFHLILLPAQATLEDARALREDALEAEAEQEWELAEQLWIRVLVVSPGDRRAVKALKRIGQRQMGGAGASEVSDALPSSPSRSVVRQSKPTPSQLFPKPVVPPPQPTVDNKPATPSQPKPLEKGKKSVIPKQRQPRQTASQRKLVAAPHGQRVQRSPSPYILSDSISRRKALRVLGFGGGGLGVALLSSALLRYLTTEILGWWSSDGNRELPETEVDSRELPETEASSADWQLPELTAPTTQGNIAEFNVAKVNTQEKRITIERQRAEFVTEELGNGVSLNLMMVPAGQFTMGSPETEPSRQDTEGPQREVTVPAFLMGQYPVTQAQWQAVAQLPKQQDELDSEPSRFTGDNRPVETISWNEAVEFCQRLSAHTGKEYRLPSEAEWEYACRAGTTTPFHFGETITPELANYRGSSTYSNGPKGVYREATTDVGSFPANTFGLYDTHGNVWEWCLDRWHNNYDGAPTDGSAWVEGESELRIVRGGSWDLNPRDCRSATRDITLPGDRTFTFGFRVCCSPPGL